METGRCHYCYLVGESLITKLGCQNGGSVG